MGYVQEIVIEYISIVRKSAAQIRRLREAIQAKAFKMNNPPAFYEKKKNMKAAVTQKITEEERLDQENQVLYLLYFK